MSTKKRRSHFQEELKNRHLDLFIIQDSISLYYFTGLSLSTGILLIAQDQEILFVDGRYIEAAQNCIDLPVRLSTTENIKQWLKEYYPQRVKSCGIDSSITSYAEVFNWKEKLHNLAQENNYAGLYTLVPTKSLLTSVRQIKDHIEIEALKKANSLCNQGYHYVLELLKESISEKEVATELEIFWKRLGADGLSFDPIIAFGENSSKPHHRASEKRLSRGDIVLIDIGVQYQSYHSDMTRVIFYDSSNPKLQEIYTIVAEAQQAALDLCKPGTPIKDLDKAARDIITQKGYGEYFNHSLGHGVGLEIHEAPGIRGATEEVLQPGMAITIEPGIYLPGIGGVRIEDLIVITESGCNNLTPSSKAIKILPYRV